MPSCSIGASTKRRRRSGVLLGMKRSESRTKSAGSVHARRTSCCSSSPVTTSRLTRSTSAAFVGTGAGGTPGGAGRTEMLVVFQAPAAAAQGADCPASIAAACRREPARSPRTGNARRAPSAATGGHGRGVGRRARQRGGSRSRVAPEQPRHRRRPSPFPQCALQPRRSSCQSPVRPRERRSRGARAPGRIEARLVGAVEESRERIEVLLLIGSCFVVDDAHADRHPKCRADRVGPIDGIFDTMLFVNRPVLRRSFAHAQEGGRESLLSFLRCRMAGGKSPATCHVPNSLNGMLRLNASITQSRYGHSSRS